MVTRVSADEPQPPPRTDGRADGRRVAAVHALREVPPDPEHEVGLARHLREAHGVEGLLGLWGRFARGTTSFDAMMRRVLLRGLARRVGDGLVVGEGVVLRHPETFELGRGVFIGAHAVLQGRHDGRCAIGDHTWIGPQAFLDARDLVLGAHVGWGPGARVLGSEHTGEPLDVHVIRTDLVIRPVRVEDGADVGTGAVLLPGVTVGRGSIVGAGAVVTRDVAPLSIVAGVPARHVRWRDPARPAAEE